MNIQKILIVARKTKYEFQKYQFLFSEMKHLEDIQKRVYDSHLRQIKSEDFLKNKLKIPFVFLKERKDLETLQSSEYDLIVSLGGDNHFVYVSHFCRESLILGCNSDSKTSTGSLLHFEPKSLLDTISQNWKNTQIEEWSLIEGKIFYPNGKTLTLPSATAEVTLRNHFPDGMSRFCLQHKDNFQEHRCTGLLIYNGVGSTGWIASYKEKSEFSKRANYFYCFSRELRNKQKQNDLEELKVETGEVLSIFSNTEDAEICVDCLKEKVFSFPVGSKVEFKLSKNKQKVLVKK